MSSAPPAPPQLPRSTVHLARMRAGLEPGGTDALPGAVEPARPSVRAAGSETERSWQEWYAPVEPLAAYLLEEGVEPGDRVLILSETRMEWFQSDLAIAAAGAVSVPAFPNLPAPQLEQILADAAPVAAFVSTPALLEELMRAPSSLRLRVRILMPSGARGGVPIGDSAAAGASAAGGPSGAPTRDAVRPPRENAPSLARPWAEAVESGAASGSRGGADLAAVRRGLALDTIATLIYTSGTGGRMRGVLLTHGNLLSSAVASALRIGVTAADTYLSFLPLSHVLERVVHLSMIWAGARLHYAEGLDRLEAGLRRTRPTIVVGVPRLYEKVVIEGEDRAQGISRRAYALFRMAERSAIRANRRRLRGRPRGPAGWLWNALVYRRIRAALGGRVRIAISGGAPLGAREALFLNGAGLPLVEGYGLTETASVVAVGIPGEWKVGSVGRMLPGNEARIGEDGEILLRGPSVMRGYHQDPDATRDAFDDGWLRSGDIGRIDAEGYLFVTDRKKDLIVTSQGKKVAPQSIESRLRRSPLIREAVVVGDRRPYLTAILFPDLDRLRARTNLSLPEGPQLTEGLRAPTVHAVVRAEVDRCCRHLASHELVRDFVLVADMPQVADGSLTPTQKLRRAEIVRRYAAPVADLYRGR